jgi:hypothetical protein
MWADGLWNRDLTAAEREDLGPAIWRARAIADDPSAYEERDYLAVVKELERAYGRWTSASGPAGPGPTPTAPS